MRDLARDCAEPEPLLRVTLARLAQRVRGALRLGARGFVAKPFSDDELRARIGETAVYTAPEPLGRASIRYFALAVGDDTYAGDVLRLCGGRPVAPGARFENASKGCSTFTSPNDTRM